MFDLKDAYNNITLEEIFSKVSEYELWKRYCKNFEEFGKSFMSEFYNDSNPDCRIYRTDSNRLRYKDFGNGDNLSIIEYIQRKYSCTFKECLNIIANDFNLSHGEIVLNRQQRIIQLDETITEHPKTRIDIVQQPYTIIDYNYWNQYSIPLTLLEEYNVFSCKYVRSIKGNKIVNYSYNKNNPIYAYRFGNKNEYTYKIYFPYANKGFKWINNCNNVIQGYDQLSLSSDILILTKSLKDVMCYRLLGYDAISLQGEGNRLDPELLKSLHKRFKHIIVNYDNDDQGTRSVEGYFNERGIFIPGLRQLYDLKFFYIDDEKDLSDYIKANNITIAKQLINDKINQCQL